MNKEWRPPEWKNPFNETPTPIMKGSTGTWLMAQETINYERKLTHLLYEEGASAMLKALRNWKWSEHFNSGECDGAHSSFDYDGTLVFIPDETNLETPS